MGNLSNDRPSIGMSSRSAIDATDLINRLDLELLGAELQADRDSRKKNIQAQERKLVAAIISLVGYHRFPVPVEPTAKQSVGFDIALSYHYAAPHERLLFGIADKTSSANI